MPKEAATQAKEQPQSTHTIPTDLNREGVADITTTLRRLSGAVSGMGAWEVMDVEKIRRRHVLTTP